MLKVHQTRFHVASPKTRKLLTCYGLATEKLV